MPSTDSIRAVNLSLHDVSPATWPACERVIKALQAVAPVAMTLLVVPDYHRSGRIDQDADFLRAMEARLAAGDELALHGYYHLDDAAPGSAPWDALRRRFYTAGEGEFAALPAAEARARLERGLALFTRLGWPCAGFVAPAWLLGPGAWEALRDSPFLYTTTLRGLYNLRNGHYLATQSLVYSVRSPWRVWLSRRWNPLLFRRLQDKALIRLSLHPADAAHPEVLRDWQRFLASALEERQAMTKEHFARTCV